MGIKDIKNLQSLFDPAVSRNATIREVESYTSLTLDDINGSVGASSSSFKLDPPGAPLKSTQQIPLDFSKFENHTFFNSAESNVNVAFERIINHYPFDGTYTEQQDFLQSLTGFEKYVFDQFPKYKNYARFTRGSGGYISVDDFAGSAYPSLSRDTSGKSIIDPGDNSFTLEMQLRFPDDSPAPNTHSVIVQKISGALGSQTGFTLATRAKTSYSAGDPVDVTFLISSGANIGLSASMDFPVGDWVHLAATYDRSPGEQKIKLFQNAELISTS